MHFSTIRLHWYQSSLLSISPSHSLLFQFFHKFCYSSICTHVIIPFLFPAAVIMHSLRRYHSLVLYEGLVHPSFALLSIPSNDLIRTFVLSHQSLKTTHTNNFSLCSFAFLYSLVVLGVDFCSRYIYSFVHLFFFLFSCFSSDYSPHVTRLSAVLFLIIFTWMLVKLALSYFIPEELNQDKYVHAHRIELMGKVLICTVFALPRY